MLIATLAALYMLFFGGSGGTFLNDVDQISDLVAEHVADEQIAGDAERVLEEMRAELTGFLQELQRVRQRAFEIDIGYSSTRVQYEGALRALDAAWRHRQERIVDLRFELRDLLTREEWDALFSTMLERRGGG